MTVTKSEFVSNNCTTNGAMRVGGGVMDISSNTIWNLNRVSSLTVGSGGAVYVTNNGVITMTDVSITSNTDGTHGMVTMGSGDITCTRCTFTNNIATVGNGAAINILGVGTVTTLSSTFTSKSTL